MIRTSIVSRDEALSDLHSLLSGTTAVTRISYDDVTTVEAVVDGLVANRSEIAILGPDVEESFTLSLATVLRTSHPEIECLAYRLNTPTFLVSAVRAGVRDVFDPHGDGIQVLAENVTALVQSLELRRQHTQAPVEDDWNGGTITIIGPKGGTGKTTVAVNLALALCQINPGEVVLVDLDLVAGEVTDVLNLEAVRSVANVAGPNSYQDPTTLKMTLSSHASGLFVLPAPASLLDAEMIDQASLFDTLVMLSNLFRYVVVDTGPGSTDATVTAVKASKELVLVATPDVGGLRTLDRHLEAFAAARLDSARRHFVLNKADSKSGVTVANAEDILGLDVDFVIPADRQFLQATNLGSPFLESKSRGLPLAPFTELAATITGVQAEVPSAQPEAGQKRRFW